MYIHHDSRYPYTYADYALLPEGAPVQLIGGELVRESPTVYHQQISGILSFELFKHVRERRLGIVYVAPMDVYFDTFDTFQPDIIFISSERRGIIGKKQIDGAPDMVVEILSPSSIHHDMAHKMVVYERSGVREYWIVDPAASTVDVFVNAGGTFKLDTKVAREGVVPSRVIEGFAIDAAVIFGDL